MLVKKPSTVQQHHHVAAAPARARGEAPVFHGEGTGLRCLDIQTAQIESGLRREITSLHVRHVPHIGTVNQNGSWSLHRSCDCNGAPHMFSSLKKIMLILAWGHNLTNESD